MDITKLDDDITAYCMKASSFPEGVQQAHQTLHALVPYDRNRKYFGISYPVDGQITYWAAAAELNEGELSKHGLETFVIKKGNYLFVDIKDFMQHIDQIGCTFKELIADERIDPKGACVEWYLDNITCRCMVRMAD
jgi:predicted transcriptional regulator YdeE